MPSLMTATELLKATYNHKFRPILINDLPIDKTIKPPKFNHGHNITISIAYHSSMSSTLDTYPEFKPETG